MTKLITIDYEEYLKLKETEKQINIKLYNEQIKIFENFIENQKPSEEVFQLLNTLIRYYRDLIIQKGDEE